MSSCCWLVKVILHHNVRWNAADSLKMTCCWLMKDDMLLTHESHLASSSWSNASPHHRPCSLFDRRAWHKALNPEPQTINPQILTCDTGGTTDSSPCISRTLALAASLQAGHTGMSFELSTELPHENVQVRNALGNLARGGGGSQVEEEFIYSYSMILSSEHCHVKTV